MFFFSFFLPMVILSKSCYQYQRIFPFQRVPAATFFHSSTKRPGCLLRWSCLELRAAQFTHSRNVKGDVGNKVPQSNFLSTMILNFDFVFFFGLSAILLEFVGRTESVRRWNHWFGHKNGPKTTLLWQHQGFLCRTGSVQHTNSNKKAINAKKEDIFKIENHCIKKIKLGYLECYS